MQPPSILNWPLTATGPFAGRLRFHNNGVHASLNTSKSQTKHTCATAGVVGYDCGKRQHWRTTWPHAAHRRQESRSGAARALASAASKRAALPDM